MLVFIDAAALNPFSDWWFKWECESGWWSEHPLCRTLIGRRAACQYYGAVGRENITRLRTTQYVLTEADVNNDLDPKNVWIWVRLKKQFSWKRSHSKKNHSMCLIKVCRMKWWNEWQMKQYLTIRLEIWQTSVYLAKTCFLSLRLTCKDHGSLDAKELGETYPFLQWMSHHCCMISGIFSLAFMVLQLSQILFVFLMAFMIII